MSGLNRIPGLIGLLTLTTIGGCAVDPLKLSQQDVQLTVLSARTGEPIVDATVTGDQLSDLSLPGPVEEATRIQLEHNVRAGLNTAQSDREGRVTPRLYTTSRAGVFGIGGALADEVTGKNWAFRISVDDRVDAIKVIGMTPRKVSRGEHYVVEVDSIGPPRKRR